MTIASETRKLGCAAILVGLAAGCSGGGDADDAGQAPLVLNEVGFVSVKETPNDPGYCGHLNLGTELDTKIVDIERYYYPVINRLLEEDPELQRYTGLTQVASCDDARLFIRLNNEYQDQRPPTLSDKAKLLESFPTLPAEPPKRDPNAPVEKILGGIDDAVEEIVGFGFQIGDEKQNCTGVRLAGTVFLTAAHCMHVAAANDPPATEPYLITFANAWLKHIVDDTEPVGELYATDPSGCKNTAPNEPCHSLSMVGYMNPNYAGQGDRRNDLAVVHVVNGSQKALRQVPEALSEFSTQVAFIATATPKLGDNVESVGWGPDGNRDRIFTPNEYLMRHSAVRPVATMDGAAPSKEKGVYQGTWFSTTAATGAQICRGDSGGPAYDAYRHVMGVASLLSATDPVHTSCARIGAAQYMSRTDYQVFSFIPQAMRKLQTGDDTALCSCRFVPSGSDPTGKDFESPGAHVRCNIGCKDPADWTQ
jgi:hypothetical protein